MKLCRLFIFIALEVLDYNILLFEKRISIFSLIKKLTLPVTLTVVNKILIKFFFIDCRFNYSTI